MKRITFILFLCLPLLGFSQALIDHALEKYRNQDYKAAAKAYAQVTAENPYHGAYWYRYGYACLRINQLSEAIQASKRAIDLSVAQTSAMYNIGSCYALQGDPEKALDWLEKAVSGGYQNLDRMKSDKDLRSLKKLPRFQQLVNDSKEQPRDRVTAWRADLKYLVARMERVHKNLFHSQTRSEWEQAITQLEQQIPQMSDLEIIGALMRLMAQVKDGHTVLYPPFAGPYTFNALPLEFYFFKNDLYIRAAAPTYQNVVGTKVLKVGGMPVEKLIEATEQLLARDNSQQLKWMLPIALGFSDLYPLIGASTTKDAVSFTLEKPDGKELSTTINAGSLTRDPMGRFAPEHWSQMKGSESLLWTKDPNNYYWYEYLPAQQAVYLQFNQVRNKEEQPIADFSKALFQFIDQNEVNTLIIDIRLNNGGNNFLNQAFMHELIKCEKINQHGKLFTIIGRRTFSAAMNLASDLENHTATLFVGEPTGSRPNFYGEDNEFVLPHSGLSGSISSRYWQGGSTSDDARPWIAPHLVAELSAEQYVRGVDPAMEAIWEYLAQSRK